jgi:hypothetical protein
LALPEVFTVKGVTLDVEGGAVVVIGGRLVEAGAVVVAVGVEDEDEQAVNPLKAAKMAVIPKITTK